MIIETAADMAQVHSAAFQNERAWTEAEFQALLDQPGVEVFGTEQGFMLVRLVADEAEILTIAVHPSAQQKGIGSKLIQRGLRHAAAQGAAHTFLEVASDNLPALALYTRHGFVQAGRRKAYYKRANGPPVDAVMMKASLTEGHTPD